MEPEALVVDDEPDLVASYRRLLGRHGVAVVAAGSRAEALAALAARTPRFLIVDLGLPDGSGLDVVRAARGLPTPAPVIVVTGVPSAALREAAVVAGAAACLAKPFSTKELSELIARLLDAPPA